VKRDLPPRRFDGDQEEQQEGLQEDLREDDDKA
jgi:hypothetical protein